MAPRALIAACLLIAACGPPPAKQPADTGEHGWFCPKARFQPCYRTQPDCLVAYSSDICVLTKPVYCESDTMCFATRYDCEDFSICYPR